jgi:lipopolysaccharide export system permease protein
MLIKSINIYLAKNFIKRFLQLTCAFSLLIFFISFIEIFNRTNQNKVTFIIKLAMSMCSVPQLINEISSSLILISAIICYFNLSMRSEITIIRNSGLSLWHIATPISISALFIGIFWIVIFQPLSIKSSKLLENFENINFGEHKATQDGKKIKINSQKPIWLRQENLENEGEEIIIGAEGLDQDNLKFYNVSLWFFNKEGLFYKRVDSEEMALLNENLILKNNIINQESLILNNEEFQKNFNLLSKESNKNLNQQLPKLVIKTNLSAEFILKKIFINTQNINNFNVFEIPKLIEEMENSGLNSQKYRVRLHYLCNLWLMFVAMTLIACYFGINHARNQKSLAMIFIGIIVGVAFYIASSIFNSIGSSGLISVFASTWMVSLICIATGILLIYHKEMN